MTIPLRATAAFGTYLAEINRTPLLTAADERALAARVRAGDAEARDRMVRSNLRLVVTIARDYAGRGLLMEDLVADGNMGLLRAVEGFDPTMNTRFSTYASYWIKQSIQRAIVNTAKTIRLPAYAVTMRGNWRRAAAALTDELGHPPTREEVAGRLGLSERKLRVVTDALGASGVPRSDYGEDGRGIAETLTDPDARAVGAAMWDAEAVEQVRHLLAAMSDREATVLRMRFGIGGGEPKTLKEIGEHLGLTRERVRQIENAALAKMGDDIQSS